MTKRGTVVLHPYPAPGGAHGRTGTCREVGESQGGARGGLTRRRFGWQGAPSPAPPGLSVEREGGGFQYHLLGSKEQLPAEEHEAHAWPWSIKTHRLKPAIYASPQIPLG